jgi:hypothetical protein
MIAAGPKQWPQGSQYLLFVMSIKYAISSPTSWQVVISFAFIQNTERKAFQLHE